MLGFGLFFEIIAFGLIQLIYGISPIDLDMQEGIQSGRMDIRNAFRMLQFFLITGMFIIGPAVFVRISKSADPIYSGDKSAVDLRLALIVMVGVLGFGWIVDAIVRLNFIAFEAIFPSHWISYLLDQQKETAQQMAVFLTSNSIIEDLLTTIIIAFLPALAEEYFFRGVLQEELKRKFNIHWSIIITALLFSLTHWQGLNFLGLASFGWLLGWIKQTSKSLWFPILAHFTNNLFVLLQVRSSGMSIQEALENQGSMPLWQYTIALMVVITAIFLYRKRLVALNANKESYSE